MGWRFRKIVETSLPLHSFPFFLSLRIKTGLLYPHKSTFFTKTPPNLFGFSFFSVLLPLQAFGTLCRPCADFHQNYYITRAVINVSTQTVDIVNNLPHLTFD